MSDRVIENDTNDISIQDCQDEAAVAARPILTGRVNSQIIEKKVLSVDWLQGTVPDCLLFELVKYVVELLNLKPIHNEYSFNRYDCSYAWETHGVYVLYDSNDTRSKKLHAGRITLVMPATALSSFDEETLFRLHKDFEKEFDFHCSRYDIAFDDYDKIISPSLVAEQAKLGNVTGYRKFEHRTGKCNIGKPDTSAGETCTFGSRGRNGSGKYLRFYDKEKESNGEIPAYRMELEMSKDIARQGFDLVCKSDNINTMVRWLGELLFGSIDFVDRQLNPTEKNIDRLSRLHWWQKIIAEYGQYKLRNTRKIKTIETAIDWVNTSVAPTLAMISKAIGCEHFMPLFVDLLNQSEKRLTASQLQRITAYLNSLEGE